MLDHVMTDMILFAIRRGSLYSPCQDVISMHMSSRCLLMEKIYIDGGKEPKTTQLLKRSTIILPIDLQVNFC